MQQFDGVEGTASFSGTYKRTAESLARLGLVTVRTTRRYLNPEHLAYGRTIWTQYQGSPRTVVVVTVTRAGSDFIYNGGLDK